MKRLFAVVGMVCMAFLVFAAGSDFENAQNGIQIFKALILLTIGSIAFVLFLDDYRQNKWPL